MLFSAIKLVAICYSFHRKLKQAQLLFQLDHILISKSHLSHCMSRRMRVYGSDSITGNSKPCKRNVGNNYFFLGSNGNLEISNILRVTMLKGN